MKIYWLLLLTEQELVGMIIDYDEKHDIVYIRFSESEYAYSEEKESIIIDYDEEGKVIAFEILDASNVLEKPIQQMLKVKEIAET